MADVWLDLWTGIWNDAWGYLREPFALDDSTFYNTLVEVYDDSDHTVLLDILHARMEPTCLTELRAHGAGSFVISKSDSKVLANPNLIDYRKYVRVRMNGLVVGGFIIQTRKTVIVGAGEEHDESWMLSGEGPRSWSRDASVYPAKGLKAKSADTRYFNFATEQGSWYNPSDWSTPINVYQWNSANNFWGTAPANWPDAPGAWWIWDRGNASFNMPQGYCYFRHEFNVTSAGAYSLFVAVDDAAEIYVDGELLLTTAEHAWQDTNRVDFDLEPGDHVIGIKAYNYRPDGPGGLLAALFKFGDPLVPTSATLVSYTGQSTWKVMGYPTVEPGWSMGDVFLTLLTEADLRGVRFAENWTPTFSAELDSAGEAWGDPVPWAFTVGATYEDVISSIEELGADVWVDPNNLQVHMWKKRGVNRSVEAANSGAPTEQFRNVATNPSFESSNGTAVIRTNLCINPLGSTATATTGYGVANGAVLSFDAPLKGARIAAPAAGLADSGLNLSGPITYSSGVNTYRVSMDVTGVVEDGWRISVQGTWVAANQNSAYVTVAPGETKRISLSFTSVAGAKGALYLLRQTAATASEAVVTNVLFEQTGVADSTFFAGSDRPRLRSNLYPDPHAANLPSGIRANITRPAGKTTGYRVEANAIGSYPRAVISLPVNTTAVAGGLPYTLSAEASSGTGTVALGIIYRDSAAVTLLAATSGNVPIVDGKASYTATAPAGTARIELWLGVNSNVAIGTAAEFDKVMLEQSATANEFISGSTVPSTPGLASAWVGTANNSVSYTYDSDLTPAWSGGANASNSTLLASAATSVPAVGASKVAYQSTRWAETGTKSLVIYASGALASGNVYVDLPMVTVEEGEVWTMLATARMEKPQTSPTGNSRRLAARFFQGSENIVSAQFPNEAGVYAIRHTFTVPPGRTQLTPRLQVMSSDPEDRIWWDSYTLVKGEYGGPPFDGDTPMAGGYTYSWTGAPHASASISSAFIPSSEGVIILSKGHNLITAEEVGQAEIANTLMLHSTDGWTEAVAPPTSITKYGRVETQISTQLSSTGASPLVDELFRTKALPEKSATFEIIPVEGMIPFLDFNVGDIISAPGEVPGVLESRRVMSISFNEDSATGKPQFSLEFDTIFKDRQTELEKWVSRVANSSALGGGFSNSSTLPPTSVQAPPGSPLGSVPDAPTGLIVSSVGHFGEDGTSLSDYALNWNPVVTGTGFGSVQITEYEVWGRPVAETESGSMAVVFDTFAYLPNFRSGDEWVFKVRAVSRTGGPGPFSSEVALVAANPIISLGKPSTPTLTTSMGTVTINWDGLIAGVPSPGYVRYLKVERTHAGSTGTWEEKRRNIFADPRATSLTRFSSTGGATVALTLRTDMTGPTTTAVRSTRNATGSARLLDVITSSAMLPSTAYRTRMRVRSSHALTNVIVSYRPDVAVSGATVQVDVLNIPIGESYIDVVGITHANAPSGNDGVTITQVTGTVGATLDVTDILIEKMPSDGTMVAGDMTSADPNKRYRWAGAANGSLSLFEELDPWIQVGTLVNGQTVDASAFSGDTYSYRLIAVDTYGGLSTPSDPATITVQGVQSGDITGGLASQNLVANGSFEEGFNNWEIRSIYPNGGAGAQVMSSGGIAGAKYLKLTRGSEISGAETPLSVGQTEDSYIPISSVGAQGYFISAKVQGAANYTDAFSLYAYWYQGDKTTIASSESSGAVDFADVTTTAQYLVGQVFPPADARFMRVVMVNGVQNSVLSVDDVVAREIVNASMIGQNAITAVHVSAGSITANALQVGSVTADALAAGSILADKIGAGVIQTSHLAAEVGASLDISSNASVNILINRQDTVEGDLAETQETVQGLQTYYNFTIDGAIIGKTDSAFKLFLKNDRIEILENGVVVSYWDSGQMVVDRFVGSEVVLSNHKFEKYGTGTIVKKL